MSIITISRGCLSGGGQFAEQLGAKLGYRVISREVIVQAAERYGVSEAELANGMQSPPGLWARLTGHKERYVLAVQAILAESVAQGCTIYHGNAGHLLLKELPYVLKLKLLSPLEQRIRAGMIEQGLTREQALRHIETVDQERIKWVRHIYGVEWSDPGLYDLVINLEHVSVEAAVDLVSDLTERPEFRADAERERRLQDFVLATRVRAALEFHSEFQSKGVEVDVSHAVVRLSGGPYLEKHQAGVVSFVKGIPGVVRVIPDESRATAPGLEELPSGRRAAEFMIPISSYPHISASNTIREAMGALGASSVVLADGHLVSPRYVLVFDERNELVGITGRRDLLRGLTPQLRSLEKARQQVAAVVPLGSAGQQDPFRWLSLFSPAAQASSWEPVADIMAPIRVTVDVEDDLGVVVSAMLQHGIDLLPVTRDRKAVGVILMTDVFDTVAQFILEKAVEAPG